MIFSISLTKRCGINGTIIPQDEQFKDDAGSPLQYIKQKKNYSFEMRYNNKVDKSP